MEEKNENKKIDLGNLIDPVKDERGEQDEKNSEKKAVSQSSERIVKSILRAKYRKNKPKGTPEGFFLDVKTRPVRFIKWPMANPTGIKDSETDELAAFEKVNILPTLKTVSEGDISSILTQKEGENVIVVAPLLYGENGASCYASLTQTQHKEQETTTTTVAAEDTTDIENTTQTVKKNIEEEENKGSTD